MPAVTGTSSFAKYAEIWLDSTGCERQIFTTGQIAKLAHVAPRTVTKWFEKGLLKGWKIPGSEDRRISRDSYIAFCHEFNIPLIGFVEHIPITVLMIGLNLEITIPENGVCTSYNNFFACYDEFNPYAVSHRIAVIVDAAIGAANGIQFVRSLRAKTPGKILHAHLFGDMTAGEIDAAKLIGYTGCFQSYEIVKLQDEITRFSKDDESVSAISKRYRLNQKQKRAKNEFTTRLDG